MHKAGLTPVNLFKFGRIQLDFIRSECFKDGEPVELSAKEMDLLRYLINRRGETLSRGNILQHVWREHGLVTERTIDVHVASLRQKIEDKPNSPEYILTVRGEGYCFGKP